MSTGTVALVVSLIAGAVGLLLLARLWVMFEQAADEFDRHERER